MPVHRHPEVRRLATAIEFICLALLSADAFAKEVAPSAALTDIELRVGVARAQEPITAFRITYEIEYPADEGWPAGAYLRRTVAAASPYFFFHETAHGHRDLPWQDDNLLRRCYVVGDHAIDEWVNARSYSYTPLEPDEGLPGSMPTEFLIEATGMWPLDGRTTPSYKDGSVFAFRDLETSDQYNAVRPLQEQCDGSWCHVLERPGRDSLWIDAQRNFAVMARELRDAKSGRLLMRIESGGYKEAKPQIWLPAWIRNIHFDFAAKTPEERQRMVVDSTLRLLDVQVNEEVSPSMFQFTPPSGALWLNPPGGRPVQTSPGGEELLDQLAEWALKYRRADSIEPTTMAKVQPFGYALVALMLLEIVLQLQQRRPGLRATLPKQNVPARRT
jgi:hypothetical protein